ncbi:hypothetical protein B0H65DRAFT_570694 [Neurospora tetraspora]|uniref:Uncharacterized protein n=1 Tax=Neurospora tetraspora TaxID=94610 RepID=A0AAE0JGV0_9PEZI|nr:hypothetical protein B0H65DRAFT_570694 [Neurospora tetraspora]
MPAMNRIGYAVGVIGLAALQGIYTVAERDLAKAGTNELAEKLHHRELLCGDILCAVLELEQNAKHVAVNEDVVIDTDDTVHKDVAVVVDNSLIVDEYNTDHEFVCINESDAEMSQADSAEWELVSEVSDYLI